MILFICIAAALCAAAALILTRPAWWRRVVGRRAGLAAEVDALAGQLRQLDGLHRDGALDDEQHARSKALVERKLLDAIGAHGAGRPTTPPDRPSRALAAGLTLFMAVVATGGYLLLGSPHDLESTAAAASAPTEVPAGNGGNGGNGGNAAPHDLSPERIAAMTDGLAARLGSNPDDADGWAMLARSFAALGQNGKTIDAFAKAEHLRPNDADLLADYADALAMTQGRQLTGQPAALIERALKIDPKNSKALALAGTAAFDRQDYKAAVERWETLVRVETADGPLASQVQAGLAEARRLGGMAPSPAPLADAAQAGAATPSQPEDAGRAQVAGTVTLASFLQHRAAPDDTVFVFARAADGGRMPLAILRKQVKDLPLQFRLDDSLAMSPTARLSGVPMVIVGARISHSGNAMPQGGDLQGLGAAVAVGATGLHIEINQEVAR
jgi:cytochrome c-type biogenesis protein CcmH